MSALVDVRLDEARVRDEIIAFGRSIFDRGLIAGSSGNISVRLADGWLLTPTNACLGRLDPGRISKLDFDGKLVFGDPPSKEAFLHRAMYEERSSAAAIVTFIRPIRPPCLACPTWTRATASRRLPPTT
jgi:3-dehydro-4-phosphotetronate decarboxylase